VQEYVDLRNDFGKYSSHASCVTHTLNLIFFESREANGGSEGRI